MTMDLTFVNLNDHTTKALTDSGSTANLLSFEYAKTIGLTLKFDGRVAELADRRTFQLYGRHNLLIQTADANGSITQRSHEFNIADINCFFFV